MVEGRRTRQERHMAATATDLSERAVRHLHEVLRFDTTNPPGNETACAEYIARVLSDVGYRPRVVESAPGRGSVVARLAGNGMREPLLLYGHVDVVPAEPDRWSRGPVSGDVADGCVWGRGALDMKGMVVQQMMVMLMLAEEGARLNRDVIFAATADEEAGGRAGMGYLVDHHPDLIRAEYGLSEGGGTTYYIAGRPFYDIRTAEKGTSRFRLTARGQPGHGSIPRTDTAISRLAGAVQALTDTPLPFRSTPTAARWFETVAATLGMPRSVHALTEGNVRYVMQRLPAEMGFYLHAITHDTAVPTVLRAGSKINVIPGEADALVDGRYLPGGTADQYFTSISRIVGPGVEIEPIDGSRPIEDPPAGPLYGAIERVMARHAPSAQVVPAMLTGATDAKHVARLGTHCLGFGPLRIPEGFPVERLVHGHDERIPVAGFLWGIEVLYDVVREFCKA
jgi:acetylornithine deacetylase/succinyl-diaminopimelate desuccinylase-like protein